MTKQNDFFTIPREFVLERITPKTVTFYRQVNYLDLEAGHLCVAQNPLDEEFTSGVITKLVDNIDYVQGRELVASLGLRLPSPAIMYKVIIPYLKQYAPSGIMLNHILERMRNDYSEFLEGIVFQDIGSKNCDLWLIGEAKTENSHIQIKRKLTLPHRVRDSGFKDYEVNGSFVAEDLDEFGFPKSLRQDGEFKYWGPQEFNIPLARELGANPQYKVVPIRCAEDSLDLLLNFRPRGHFNDKIGVRG